MTSSSHPTPFPFHTLVAILIFLRLPLFNPLSNVGGFSRRYPANPNQIPPPNIGEGRVEGTLISISVYNQEPSFLAHEIAFGLEQGR